VILFLIKKLKCNIAVDLFNHTANASEVNHFNNSLNEFLFGFFFGQFLNREVALKIAERESHTAGTVASIEIIMDRPAIETTDKSFWVTH